MSTIHSKDVDSYIEARSLRGLRRLMRKINAKYGARHIFVDRGNYVNDKGQNVFYAWYEPTEKETTEELDGNTSTL